MSERQISEERTLNTSTGGTNFGKEFFNWNDKLWQKLTFGVYNKRHRSTSEKIQFGINQFGGLKFAIGSLHHSRVKPILERVPNENRLSKVCLSWLCSPGPLGN